MARKMIKGCGKLVKDSGMACGDSIETGEYEEDVELVQPIYCKECWDKINFNLSKKIVDAEEFITHVDVIKVTHVRKFIRLELDLFIDYIEEKITYGEFITRRSNLIGDKLGGIKNDHN